MARTTRKKAAPKKAAPKKPKTCYLSAPRVTEETRDTVLELVGEESMAAWMREAVEEKLERDRNKNIRKNGL